MGKCKICGAHIDDGETLCEDCKALGEMGEVKTDDELNELLDTVQYADIDLHNREQDDQLSEKSVDHDSNQREKMVSSEENKDESLEDITSNLLAEFSAKYGDDESDTPLSLDELQEDEPLSLDTLQQEEPLSFDTLQQEEPLALDELQGDEPLSLDSLKEDEPLTLDALQEKDLVNTSSLSEESMQSADESLHDKAYEPMIDLSEYGDIFDGIDEAEADNTEASDLGNIISDVLGNITNKSLSQQDEENPSKEQEGKKTFFQKLFSNVEDENAEADRLKEEEKAKKLAEKKAAKKEASIEAKKLKKAAAEEKKKKKQIALAERKAKKAREAEEEAKDTTKINKKGAAVVFVAFAILCLGILVGTNTFQYSISVSKAKDNFSKKRYQDAYDMISGVDLKKADRQVAKKIKTVMYVNKELESFQSYYTIQYYAEALNSLLNGLVKYNVYLEQAGELGVKSDLEYVKGEILNELQDKYGLTESKANSILDISDREEYSDKVIAVAKEMAHKK